MPYGNILLVSIGSLMVMIAYMRFRTVLTEGLFEYYRGERVKIEQWEQPRTFWAKIMLMASSGGVGLVMISQGTSIIHL